MYANIPIFFPIFTINQTAMKNILTILFAILVSPFTFSQDNIETNSTSQITIQEALERGMIEVDVFGVYDERSYYELIDSDGIHYGKCMALKLKSKIDTFVVLSLDCGTQLVPEDTVVQTMIVTHKTYLPLYPNDIYTTKIYAMCGEIQKAVPDVHQNFYLGELGSPELIVLANYLGENRIQNMIGQHALWAYTDQVGFEDLTRYGADSTSILKSIEILNNVELETALSLEFTSVFENDEELALEEVVIEQLDEDSEMLSVNRYYIYSGIGLIFILIISITVIVIKNRKRSNVDA